jgi:hypothetical protein
MEAQQCQELGGEKAMELPQNGVPKHEVTNF